MYYVFYIMTFVVSSLFVHKIKLLYLLYSPLHLLNSQESEYLGSLSNLLLSRNNHGYKLSI